MLVIHLNVLCVVYTTIFCCVDGSRDNDVLEFWKPVIKSRRKDLHKDNVQQDKFTRSYKSTRLSLLQETGADHETTSPDVIDPFLMRDELNPYGINDQLTDMIHKFESANVTVEIIGRTVEYNDIVLLKMTEPGFLAERHFRTDNNKFEDDHNEKKIIFIVHNLVVSGSRLVPCLYAEEDFAELISIYVPHLKNFDIFVIPMANPDGFAANLTFWNKNVSPQQECGGVFLDRNFDIAWKANHGISSCSQMYPGPAPFSEVESRAIRDVFHKYGNKITGYFNVHAATSNYVVYKGDAVLYPKGYTDAQSDEDKYFDLKGEIDEAITNASFKVVTVTVDSLHHWYGPILGSSVDYASKVYGIPYAMELVMQPYETSMSHDYLESHSRTALKYVWKTVIDTIFDFIFKSLHPNEVE